MQNNNVKIKSFISAKADNLFLRYKGWIKFYYNADAIFNFDL
jgi:hypothetical protein